MTELNELSPGELHSQVQHRLIEELGATEHRLRRLLEILPEVAVQCDENGRITYLNETWHTLLGYEVEGSLGEPLDTFLLDEDRDSWPGFPRPGEADREVQLRFCAKDGEVRWFWAKLRTTVEGEHTGLLHDVTDRVELENQLRQAQKIEAVGRLAGGVAHDFNNLLTVIIGTCEGLLSSPSKDELARRAEVETVLKAADRAAMLTRQLLAFGRQQVMSFQVLSLGAVIEEMNPILKRLTGSGVVIEIDDRADGGWVRVDPTHLQQVIMNLAVNARDAMPEGGRISFEITDAELPEGQRRSGLPSGAYVRLTVSDTGTGIAPEHLNQIFDPFFTTKEAGQGTGLGLATTHGIISQSGGAIDVESRLGEGTAFHIHFPRASQEEGEVMEREMVIPSPQGDRETVLVVDDDDMIRQLAVRMLTDGGYVVLEARGVVEAKQRIEEHSGELDLVMTDMVMPENSGRVLTTWLTKKRPDIKVIVMSGLGARVQEEGTAFLEKPFRQNDLLEKVRATLDA
jgi:PAS domain S-box-containing protein